MGRTKSRKSDVPLKPKLKKDPGVPKLPSLKTKVRAAQRARPNPYAGWSNPDSVMASEPTLSTLAAIAEESEKKQEVNDPSSSSAGPSGKTKEQLRRYYLRTLHKVIDQSNIVILVLDARDPEGTRSRLVEEEVRRREGEGKKLVFVMTKIDLVPRLNAEAWLKYLRHTTPTLPFRAPLSSQHQRSNIASTTAPALMRLLKAYKPKAGSVTVGVVGYPNVGKSSLINCLKRSKVCAVAAQPGHTKDIQSVQLERGLRIVDSPGVIFDDDFDDGKSNKKSSILLSNVIRVEDVEDPITLVEEILLRTPWDTLQKLYNLPEYSSTLEFLTMLALASGKLLKGGAPDVNSAARHVLMDWNHQKIPYYSTPPTVHPSSIPSVVKTSGSSVIAPGAENVGQAQILSGFSKPFTLDGLFGAADAGAFDDVQMGDEREIDNQEPMQEDGTEMISDDLAPHIPRKRSRSPSTVATAPDGPTFQNLDQCNVRKPKRQRKSKDVPSYDTPPDQHVLQQMARSNPLNRRALKKEAKRARKTHRVQTSGAGMEIDEGLQFTFMA
ncbi:hypothetical protein APHAL10511_003059 [Amanita phalloides]|nr:hypothetical protein APHAL10511_003059 [Amanita phalloides]